MKLSIFVDNQKCSYDIIIDKGVIEQADKYLNLNRKILIITDSGVPSEYSDKISRFCKQPFIFKFECGESHKSLATVESALECLVHNKFSRTDAIVAIGGGVVGDLAGLTASLYMRGIDFYNVPTTLLAQVDSSIGGKTAVNFAGIKNNIGAFYQPKCVLIDPLTLKTLDSRLVSEGLAEAIKMAATSNRDLFDFIKNSSSLDDDILSIITEALKIKATVVEADPKEKGLRRVLNFGHTIGHAIEATEQGHFYHGECVSLGMLFLSSADVRKQLTEVLAKYNLPTTYKCDITKLIDIIRLDKKTDGETITVVYVDSIGSYEFKKMTFSELKEFVGQVQL